MSHFAVLVISKEPPTEENLAKIMAPWHEFECTGLDNEYVINVDETNDARERFEKAQMNMVVQPDGTLEYPFDSKGNFKPKYATARLSDTKSLAAVGLEEATLPEGCSWTKAPASQHQSFGEWIEGYYSYSAVAFGQSPSLENEHKYGYCTLNEKGEVDKVINRTNPNRKWDWYTIGGRYSGRILKMSGHITDSTMKQNMAWDDMISDKKKERREIIDEILKDADGTIEEFELARKEMIVYDAAWKELTDERRRLYRESNTTPAQFCTELNLGLHNFTKFDVIFNYWSREWPSIPTNLTCEQWIENSPPFTAWTVIKDGEWKECASMGWFGMHDEIPDTWDVDYLKMLNDTPQDYWMTVVDCHI